MTSILVHNQLLSSNHPITFSWLVLNKKHLMGLQHIIACSPIRKAKKKNCPHITIIFPNLELLRIIYHYLHHLDAMSKLVSLEN